MWPKTLIFAEQPFQMGYGMGGMPAQGGPPAQLAPAPPVVEPPAQQQPLTDAEEPPSKKMRGEDNLVAETEFLTLHKVRRNTTHYSPNIHYSHNFRPFFFCRSRARSRCRCRCPVRATSPSGA